MSLTKLESLSIPNFDLTGDCKSCCPERQNLAFFCNLVALNLEWNCVKCLIVIQFVKKFMFKRFEAKNFFQRQPWTKYFRKNLVFMWNSALPNKFNFYFSAVFCLYPQMFPFGRKTGNYLIILWRFQTFLIFPKVLRS